MHNYIITYEENNVLKTITICAKDDAAAIGTFYSMDGFNNANIHSIVAGYTAPIPTKETEKEKNIPYTNSEFRESFSIDEGVLCLLVMLGLVVLIIICSLL